MRKTLVLRKENLTALTTEEMTGVVGGTSQAETCTQLQTPEITYQVRTLVQDLRSLAVSC